MKTMLSLLIFALVAPILFAASDPAKEPIIKKASLSSQKTKKYFYSMATFAGYTFGESASPLKTAVASLVARTNLGGFVRISPVGGDDGTPWIHYDALPSLCLTYDTHRRKAQRGITFFDGFSNPPYSLGETIHAPENIWWFDSKKIEGKAIRIDAQPLVGCFYRATPVTTRGGQIYRVLIYGDSALLQFMQNNAGKKAGRRSDTVSKIKFAGKNACTKAFGEIRRRYHLASTIKYTDKDPIITAYELDDDGEAVRRIEFFMYPFDCPMMIAVTDLSLEAQARAEDAEEESQSPQADESGWRL